MASLDDVYEHYCSLAAELLRLPQGSPRAQKLQVEADQAWESYLKQGGGREPWHTPSAPWEYQDGFVEMRHSSTAGPVDQLRELLRLPRNVGPHYMGAEQKAVERYQEHHFLPVTGVVDRRTWQSILAEKGERKAGILPRTFHVPGSATAFVPLVIRTRRRWQLALDNVPYRTYANQHNLAVLAEYACGEPEVVEREWMKEWDKDRLREDVILKNGADRFRVFLREAADTFKHRFEFIENTDTDTQLFVLDSPSYVVVAFRGTAQLGPDLRTDLSAPSIPWMYDGTFDPRGKPAGELGLRMHQGFGEAFASVEPQLRAELEKSLADHPHKPIFVTGHSLGAALSCLCACYLRSHPVFRNHAVQLYNYAQPRVGTYPFCQHYWCDHTWPGDPGFAYFRVANFADTITMVPSGYLARDIVELRGLLEPVLKELSAATGVYMEWPELERSKLFEMLQTSDAASLLKEMLKAADSRSTLHMVLNMPSKQQLVFEALHLACPDGTDYRHFGELVLVGTNAQNQPFVKHIGEDLSAPRKVEPRLKASIESIWRSNPLKHPMGEYRRYLVSEFEQHAKAFVSGQGKAPLALSAWPELHPAETQLFHRFVHERGLPAYHSIEEYENAFR